MSLPAWGVWIEIVRFCKSFIMVLSSLPAWGVWIEIRPLVYFFDYNKSLPAWGVWIEI